MTNLDDIRSLIASHERELGRRLRILVIDDEAICFKLFRVSVPGCDVFQAVTGEIGIKMLREDPERYDCVVIDQKLPGMSGLETLKEIREQWPGVFTVMSSAFQFTDVQTQVLLKLGPTMMLPKPLRPEAITNLLRFIEERRGG